MLRGVATEALVSVPDPEAVLAAAARQRQIEAAVRWLREAIEREAVRLTGGMCTGEAAVVVVGDMSYRLTVERWQAVADIT